jgi:trehalose 6-phosphate phosphatase
MENILAPKHRSVLAAFASTRVLLGFDFDGTLAPIESHPDRAHMRARTRRLLGCVAQYFPCVVISGRLRADVAKRLDQIPLWQVIGNHGLEPWEHAGTVARRVSEWVRLLRRHLTRYPGLVVEDKKYSATVHYRHVRAKPQVRSAIAAVVRDLPDARVLGGQEAVNLLPRNGVHKGLALQKVRADLARDSVIYVGDDDTDEDAFQSAPREELLAIRVGRSRASRASYHLNTQDDVDQLLQVLLALRAPRSGVPDRRRS